MAEATREPRRKQKKKEKKKDSPLKPLDLPVEILDSEIPDVQHLKIALLDQVNSDINDNIQDTVEDTVEERTWVEEIVNNLNDPKVLIQEEAVKDESEKDKEERDILQSAIEKEEIGTDIVLNKCDNETELTSASVSMIETNIVEAVSFELCVPHTIESIDPAYTDIASELIKTQSSDLDVEIFPDEIGEFNIVVVNAYKSEDALSQRRGQQLYPDISEQLQQLQLEQNKGSSVSSSQSAGSTNVHKAANESITELCEENHERTNPVQLLQVSTEQQLECKPLLDDAPVQESTQFINTASADKTRVLGRTESHNVQIENRQRYAQTLADPIQEITSEHFVHVPKVRVEMQPLTPEQLNSLYYNRQLAMNSAFIDKFVQSEMKKNNHEFREIILSYQRSRRQLLQCEAALQNYEDEYHLAQDQVWLTETLTATVKGPCGEGHSSTATHTYEQAQLNDNALSSLKKSLKSIQDEVQNELSLHSYSAQLSRLQVESYIHNLFVSSPALRDLPQNLPVSACERHSANIQLQVQKLLSCISILFSFHRTPINDKEMRTNLQIWTERLVSALLRVATFEDHLYLLNHIMRCPSGIGSWAAHFVQTVSIPPSEDQTPEKFGSSVLDYVITALSTVLQPSSYRNEFMCQMQKMLSSSNDKHNTSWILVDSDGEEDEDPQSAWMNLHENDVVAILKQLPLATMFRHILFITKHQDSYEYDIRKTTEATMYRIYAFCTCLVHILGKGLKTYNTARYKQLNKRISRMIRVCVQYVSDHWENFCHANQGVLTTTVLQKLQLEFDWFFLRAVNFIYKSQKLGSWQFMADMPFNNVSKETMWKLLWLLHQGHSETCDISTIPAVQQCIDFVRDQSSHVQMSDVLQHVPVSEGIYLLNTMMNMTNCCTSADVDFIETVTMTIFEVSYLCEETRNFCSKVGRELLAAVVICHPFILSVLIQHVENHIEKLGQMGLYLFKGLQLWGWLPTDSDLAVIRFWLLNTDLGSPTNLMAQRILSHINWGSAQKDDRLMVPWHVHKQVAILVMEAYQKFLLGKNLGSVILEGVKQISTGVQQYSTVEQEFNSWCWELLLQLSLHRLSLPSDDYRLAVSLGEPPDVNKDDAFLPLSKGIKEKNPTALYVTLLLTKYGHSVNEFVSDGVQLLQALIEQGHYKPAISAMFYTVTLFYDNQQYLLDSVKFQEVLQSILQTDESYFRIVKGLLSYEFPGPVTKLFVSMILSQIQDKSTSDSSRMTSAVGLWAQLVLKLPKWHLDRNCCCLLDNLIAAAFTYKPALDCIENIFQDSYKSYWQQEKKVGSVLSFVNWVTSGTVLPTFLDKSSCPEFCWLTYMIFGLEGDFEKETRLWPIMQEEMLSNQKLGVDQALKKAVAKLKLDQAPAANHLNIYRWAQQALDMPIDHPMCILTWQRFFFLFLGRLSQAQSSIPQKASVGERFFTGMSYSSMIKKLKKRLGETANHYVQLSSNIHFNEGDEITADVALKRELHCKLARLYQTLQCWVEEPLLHDASLYLPSLPPQYQSDRLLCVFQGQSLPWLEYLNIVGIKLELVAKAAEWKLCCVTECNTRSGDSKTSPQHKINAKDRILSRLEQSDTPLPPPPIHPVRAPVPELSPVIMEDKSAILHLLKSDLNVLQECASQFFIHIKKHNTLDASYIDLVPGLYQNVKQQINKKWKDNIKQQQVYENREAYKQLMIELKQPPLQALVINAVHTENAITMLVKLYQSSTNQEQAKALNAIACSLFFHLCSCLSESVLGYPTTKQFFLSCIDILGKEFIQNNPSQTELVLHTALAQANLGGVLSPHYKPNLTPAVFVAMYDCLIEALQQKRTFQSGTQWLDAANPCNVDLDLIAMFLTKFEVSRWLEEYRPSKQEVKTLVNHLCVAFIACGPDPVDKYRMPFKICFSHLKSVLQYHFPQYLNEVLAALLQGSSLQRVSVEAWEMLHQNCFHISESSVGIATTESGSKNEQRSYQDVVSVLSIEQIRNLLAWLGQEFLHIRYNQKEVTSFGLYPKWQLYVPHLSKLLQDLSKCLVLKMLPNLAEATTDDGLDMVWSTIITGFAPWLQTETVNKITCQPWLTADRDSATHMVRALHHVIGYAYCKTEDIHHRFYADFLSRLWLYFATVLSRADVLPDVVAVFNLEFLKLPWQKLVPNIQVMDTMARMKETGCSLGFNLVTGIISMVPWNQVSSLYESYHDLGTNARYEGDLFLLIIQAYTEKKHLENPDIDLLLHQAQTFPWKHLSTADFRKSCAWFLQTCDPKCIQKGKHSPDALGLRVIESASGFNTDMSLLWSRDWNLKRLTYLQCVSSLLCQSTYLTECDSIALSTVIINLLTEIETVESAILDNHIQLEESSDMMNIVVGLLNSSNPDNQISSVLLTTMLQWLQGSPQTILLSPCIHAASRNLASITYMVTIVELCIELSFMPDGSSVPTGDPWRKILAAVQIPELKFTEFIQKCIQESSFLLLYCYVLQQIPLCQELIQEQVVINAIHDWSDKVKPSVENETKLLLWWNKAMDLILRQIDFGHDPGTCITLLRQFMHKVQSFGKDKAALGWLRIIGLGKKSQLSNKFRVCCRALVAFCSSQILDNDKLRVSGSNPMSTLPAANQDLNSLLILKSTKIYQPIKSDVEIVCAFVTDQSKLIRDVFGLLALLKDRFYPDIHYLSVLNNT